MVIVCGRFLKSLEIFVLHPRKSLCGAEVTDPRSDFWSQGARGKWDGDEAPRLDLYEEGRSRPFFLPLWSSEIRCNTVAWVKPSYGQRNPQPWGDTPGSLASRAEWQIGSSWKLNLQALLCMSASLTCLTDNSKLQDAANRYRNWSRKWWVRTILVVLYIRERKERTLWWLMMPWNIHIFRSWSNMRTLELRFNGLMVCSATFNAPHVHTCADSIWVSDPPSTFNVPEVLPATHLNDFCSLVKDTKFSLELLAVERFCFEVPLSSVNPPCTSINGENNIVQRMPTKRPHVLQAALERIAAFQQSTLTFILVALSLKVLADCGFEVLRQHI